MLKLENFSLAYARRRLFSRFSLSVPPGKFVIVLGRNGVGKTTLLRALAGDFAMRQGVRHAEEGTLRLNGEEIRHIGAQRLACLRAVLAQHTPNSYAVTATEVVRLGRYPHHGNTEDRPAGEIVREVLALADVSALAGRDVSRLSGGEFARVQFARALAQIWAPPQTYQDTPRYLLLDEPTAALDIAQQHRLFGTVRELTRRWHIGAFAISHDCNLVARYADRVVLLTEGQCLADGVPSEVMTPELLGHCYGIPMRQHGDWGETAPYFTPA